MVKIPLTQVICEEGIISILLGLPGSGKTNIAVYLMQRASAHGFNAYTNVHFFNYSDIPEALKRKKLPYLPKGLRYERKPESIQTVTKISDLLLKLLETEKNTVFLDEGGFFATSTAASSKKVRQLKELTYIIRHLNSSFVIIAQSKGSIVPDLRETLVEYELRIDKVSQKYRVLTIKKSMPKTNPETGEREKYLFPVDKIGGVPLATIPWDGFFLPKFKFDIDLTEAFDLLGEFNSVLARKKGPALVRSLMDEDGDKKSKNVIKREKLYDDIRKTYLRLAKSGEFKNRTSLLAHIASNHGKTMQWAYNFCRDLPFEEPEQLERD